MGLVKERLVIVNIIEEGRLGGPQIRILNVAKELVKKWDTLVLYPCIESEKFTDKLSNANVKHSAISISRLTKAPKSFCKYVIFFFSDIWGIYSVVKKKQVQLIHVSGGAWQIKGVLAGTLAKKKIVWHLNDTNMPLIVRGIFRLLSPLVENYIFASHRTKKYYENLVHKESLSRVIPAPVDTVAFDPEGTYLLDGYEWFEEKLQNSRVIGMVGNINSLKGVKTFIKMAGTLNKNHQNLLFVVIGQAFENQKEFYNEMQLLVREKQIDNLYFLTKVTDTRPFLKFFELFVCPSYFESSPIAVWEAMSMGLPVVSSDVGDVSRYIENGVSGVIVEEYSPSAFSLECEKLLNSPADALGFGKNAREVAVNNLDIKKVAELHDEIYRSILAME